MLNSLSFDHIGTDDVSFLYHSDLRVDVLRLDNLHAIISGNKWFKLRFYLENAVQQKKKGLLTFGGAWSNHIVAAAEACRLLSLQSIGIIRGEEPKEWSPALQDAKQAGMQLHFIPRSDYKEKYVPALAGIDPHEYLLVPEGGYGETGAAGASTILDLPKQLYTHYICATGTGTMMAGLINAAPPSSEVIGIGVLKNNYPVEQAVGSLLYPKHARWKLMHEFHGGGYARSSPALLSFMNAFYQRTGIPTDFVYTGKLFLAMHELVKQSFFPSGSRILVIHSGGLQGNRSLPKGALNF